MGALLDGGAARPAALGPAGKLERMQMDRSGRFLVALGGAAALMLGGCQQQQAAPPPPPDSKSVVAEVEADAQAIVADYNARNAAQAASHDAPDYVGLYAGSPPTVGPDADQASMETQMEDPSVHYQLTGTPKVTVAKSGDMAVFESGYAFTTTDLASNQPSTKHGTWVAIYQRQPNGSMMLWRSILVAGPKTAAPQV
jgi:ketosteroid isomerase-like protein